VKFNCIRTDEIYRRILAESDMAKRETIFREEIVAPYQPLTQIFGGGDGMSMFSQWTISALDANNDAAIKSIMDKLAAYGAWEKTASALEVANQAFAPYADKFDIDMIQFGIFPYRSMLKVDREGYSGFGGFPGYIMVTYSSPNDYNLPRIQGCTVHELHHNVRFKLYPFNMMTTNVGDYIIAEGLAESFAAELFGEDIVGFYVTDFDESRFEEAKRIIGGALNVTGFNQIRGYIFGDTVAEQMNLPKAGVPDYAGYALGYRVVQAYIKRTGKTIAETTFVPSAEIIAESGFFD
jgi:uncharacterized protein YjaZ